MKVGALRFRSSPRSGMLLALVAVVLLCAADARAGCSNHSVTSRYELTRKSARLEILSRAGSLPLSLNDTPAKAPAPAPCSGAFCSDNSARAPSPITTNLQFNDGEQAIASSTAYLTDAGSRERAELRANLHSVARARSIFHPPRFQVAVNSF
jgi:hypothetical protein